MALIKCPECNQEMGSAHPHLPTSGLPMENPFRWICSTKSHKK